MPASCGRKGPAGRRGKFELEASPRRPWRRPRLGISFHARDRHIHSTRNALAMQSHLLEFDLIEHQLHEAEAELVRWPDLAPSDRHRSASGSLGPKPSDPVQYSQLAKVDGGRTNFPVFMAAGRLPSPSSTHQPFKTLRASAHAFRRRYHTPTTFATSAAALSRLAQPRNEIYKERESLRREQEALKLAEAGCTFKPSLCEGTEKRVAAAAAASREEVVKPLPERLMEKKKASEQARRIRQAKVLEEQARECTFRPVLYTSASSGSGGRVPPSSTLISPSQCPKREKPLHERLGDVQRARREHLARLRAEREEVRAAEWTFQPRLCGMTEGMARQRRLGNGNSDTGTDQEKVKHPLGRQSSTFSRLVRDSERFLQQRMARRSASEARRHVDCRFAPTLAQKTDELLVKAGWPSGFEARQQLWEDYRREKAVAVEQAMAAEEERWFKPVLEPKSEAIVARIRSLRESKGHESDERPNLQGSVVHRLAVEERARREAARQARTMAALSEFHYEPSINPLSRALGRSSDIEELTYNWRGVVARNKAAEEAQARFEAACTFQPEISNVHSYTSLQRPALGSRSGHVSSKSVIAKTVARNHGKVKDRSLSGAQQPTSAGGEDRWGLKEAQAADTRAAREAEELKACTWSPLLTKNMSRPRMDRHQSPVLVRGLGKFLARSQAAAQQRQGQASATAALAVGGARMRTNCVPSLYTMTTSRPFRLSSRPQDQRGSQAKVRSEIERLARSSLTFRPQTIERRKQAVLHKLLQTKA